VVKMFSAGPFSEVLTNQNRGTSTSRPGQENTNQQQTRSLPFDLPTADCSNSVGPAAIANGALAGDGEGCVRGPCSKAVER